MEGNQGPTTPDFRPRYAWYVVCVLMFANTVSYVDRQILNLLVEPIKADLSLSDTQIATVQGIAFAIFYATMGIPIARIADLTSRKLIITAGAGCWSIATVLCGLASSYWHLFSARILVGVGESSLSPAAYSMVADLFPKEKMARPMGVIAGGIFAGAGVAYLIGGFLIDWVAGLGEVTLPLVGIIKPWALSFVMVGAPLGVVMILLLLTIREPARRSLPGGPELDVSPSLGDVVEFIKDRVGLFVPLFVGLSLIAMLTFGMHAWAPTYFIRLYDLSISEVGATLGLTIVVCGGLGVYFGGWYADYLLGRGRNDAHIRVLLLVAALLSVLITIFPFMPSANLVFVVFGVVQFVCGAPIGVAAASIQMITPNRMRGQVTAVYLLFTNLIGAGLGPVVIAVFTDQVFMSEQKIGSSIALAGAIFGPMSLLLLGYCRRMFASEVDKTFAVSPPSDRAPIG